MRKILEVRGEAVGAAAHAPAPPEFLVLLLEAARFVTYVLHVKVEGWSIGERGADDAAAVGEYTHPTNS